MSDYAGPLDKGRGKLTFVLMGGIVAALVVLTAIVLSTSGRSKSTPQSTTLVVAGPVATPKTKDVRTVTGIGQSAHVGSFRFTVSQISRVDRIGRGESAVSAQGKFAIITITVKNVWTTPRSFDPVHQEIYDQQGRRFYADTDKILDAAHPDVFSSAIDPGVAVQGTLVFDLPSGSTPMTLQLHDSSFPRELTMPLS